jgi:hypothetical protein
MDVQCPYFYYPTPQENYGWKTPCGRWYSFPRAGERRFPLPPPSLYLYVCVVLSCIAVATIFCTKMKITNFAESCLLDVDQVRARSGAMLCWRSQLRSPLISVPGAVSRVR